MYKIVSKKLLEAVEANASLRLRTTEARRWLSEFDWLLKPMWDYLIDGNKQIQTSRESMRHALDERKIEIRNEAVELYRQADEKNQEACSDYATFNVLFKHWGVAFKEERDPKWFDRGAKLAKADSMLSLNDEMFFYFSKGDFVGHSSNSRGSWKKRKRMKKK